MCGIVAILAHGEPVQAPVVDRALAALRHRGPDGESKWIAPMDVLLSDMRAYRSSVLNNGTQPIANEDGQIQVVVNGEFYDFERIRRELQARGHVFRTESDSEIALHLYEDYVVGLPGAFAGRVCVCHLGRQIETYVRRA